MNKQKYKGHYTDNHLGAVLCADERFRQAGRRSAHTHEKAFFRNFVAFIIAFAVLIRSRDSFHFQKKNLPFLIGRSLAGTVGILGNFYALGHLSSLGDASILNKMSPFFAVIFSVLLLREKLEAAADDTYTDRRVHRGDVRRESHLPERGALPVAVRTYMEAVSRRARHTRAMVRALGLRGRRGAL